VIREVRRPLLVPEPLMRRPAERLFDSDEQPKGSAGLKQVTAPVDVTLKYIA
jgi:hypothetical protein